MLGHILHPRIGRKNHACFNKVRLPVRRGARRIARRAGALDDPDVKKRLADLGGSLPGKDERTPAKFTAFVNAEIARWSPVLKAAERGGK